MKNPTTINLNPETTSYKHLEALGDMKHTPPINIDIKPGEPVRLIPGSIYVIETEAFLSSTQRDAIRNQLDDYLYDYDIKFIILDGGLKLAKLEKDEHS